MKWAWPVRVALVAVALVGAVALYVKRQATPEQEDLIRYVNFGVPHLMAEEAPLRAGIDRLASGASLKAEEARALLVDELIPGALHLKKSVSAYQPQTAEVRALHAEYAGVVDAMLQTCRQFVAIIDDPKTSTLDGKRRADSKLAEVRAAYHAWQEHVAAVCAKHGLVTPSR